VCVCVCVCVCVLQPNIGLCQKCHDIIEWKKQYRKYKPRTMPGKWYTLPIDSLRHITGVCEPACFINMGASPSHVYGPCMLRFCVSAARNAMRRKSHSPIIYFASIVPRRKRYVPNVVSTRKLCQSTTDICMLSVRDRGEGGECFMRRLPSTFFSCHLTATSRSCSRARSGMKCYTPSSAPAVSAW
jgi:hypothetical protein